jgi:hypothetical protein
MTTLRELLRIWLFLFFTYLTMKVIFNVILFGLIDLRRASLLELLFLPAGQAVAYWALTRHKKRSPR